MGSMGGFSSFLSSKILLVLLELIAINVVKFMCWDLTTIFF